MMTTRPVATRLLVLLCLIAGFTTGLLAGRLWGRMLELQMRRARSAVAFRVQKTVHSEAWRQDSIRVDSIWRVHQRDLPREIPREIARGQLLRDCVVTFQLPEGWRFQVFTSHARDLDARLIGSASTYSPDGFSAGMRATVAFEDVECEQIATLSRGGGIGPLQADSMLRRHRAAEPPAAPDAPRR
jgi:hypothetical protein